MGCGRFNLMGTTNSGNTIFFFPLSNILHLIVNFLCQPGVRGFERRFDRGGGGGVGGKWDIWL